MKSNLYNEFKSNQNKAEEFMKLVEEGNIEPMIIAAANIATWSTSLMKGLNKLAEVNKRK